MLAPRVRVVTQCETLENRPFDRPRPGAGSGSRYEHEREANDDESAHRHLLVVQADNYATVRTAAFVVKMDYRDMS